MAVKTPDKPKVKPVDLMDASWAKAPVGYEKTPFRSPDEAAGKTAPDAASVQKQSVTPAATAPAAAPAVPQAVQASPVTTETVDTFTETVDTFKASPAAAQPGTDPQAHTLKTVEPPKPADALIALPLNTSFAPAANVDAWRTAHGIPKTDFATVEEQRQREKAMTAGLIDNGFFAEQKSTFYAMPGEPGEKRAGDEEKRRERERERTRNLVSSFSLEGLQISIRDTIVGLETSIEEAKTLRNRLSDELSHIRADIKNTAIQIAASEQKVTQLEGQRAYGQIKMQALFTDYSTLHEEYQRKSEEDRQKFGDKRNPQDAELHQKAWEENRNKVELHYKQKGLGEEFKILEKVKNGEPVDQKAFDQAMEKIREKDITLSTLDMAMLKVNKDNDYFKTTSGLSVRMMEKTMRLHQVDKELEKNQKELTEELDNLKAFRKVMDGLKVKEKVTEEQIAKVDEFIELKNEQMRRTTELESKISNPEFQKKYDEGKLSREEYESHYKEYVQLKRDIIKTNQEYENFVKENWPDYSRDKTLSITSATATTEKNTIENSISGKSNPNSRTTTDSAAGLTDNLLKADKMAVSAFSKAAPPPEPAPEPDMVLTAATVEQRRTPAPAPGGLTT